LNPIGRIVTTEAHQGDHHTSGGATVTPASARIALVLSVLGSFLVPPARADEIMLGPSDFFVSNQPRVMIQMEYPVNSGVPFGEPVEFYLDTGASGILFATGSYFENPNYYNVEHRTDGSVVQYEETGVAGTQLLDVFQPHDFYFAGTDGTTTLLPNIRPFGSIDADLADVNGLVGMPAMINRVTRLNLQNQLDLSSDNWSLIDVSFHTNAPAPPVGASPRFHVPLKLEPPGFPGVDPDHPDDPKPEFAANPFVIGLGHTFVDQQSHSHTVYRNALLDTGAQNSIISHQLAIDLGINLNRNDPGTDIEDIDGDGTITNDDYLEVGGLGGSVFVPLVHLAKLSVPTKEGTYISVSDVDVAVFVDPDGNSLDIPGLDSVLGMNFLTSGYLEPLLFEAATGDPATGGFINDVTLDFRDPNNPEMLLDLNPEFSPEPGALALFVFSLGMLGRPKRKCHSNRKWLLIAAHE
jgi:hypothetical protein